MGRLLVTFVLAVFLAANQFGQGEDREIAAAVRSFETSWLTAQLNYDKKWLSRMTTGKHDTASLVPAFRDRDQAIAHLMQDSPPPSEMKVRISGTIALLTNDPTRNRSFFFLDTFNKLDGKWRVIASSISAVSGNDSSTWNTIEPELLELENEWAKAVRTNNQVLLEKIIASEFTGTAANGEVTDRDAWIRSLGYQGTRGSVLSDVRVRAVTETLAVATGVNTVVTTYGTRSETVGRENFTHTWTKRNGIWQCVAAHVSKVK